MIKNHFRFFFNGIRFKLFILLFVNILLILSAFGLQIPETDLMKKGIPVWVQGREKEMNLNLGFRGIFQSQKNKNATFRITASTLYRVYINGDYLGYGPARTGHGFFRVDEYDLSKHLKIGDNIVAVEVAGYNVNSYYTLDQPSFLQAEVESDGKIILSTGSEPGFEAFQIKERLQKV